jgi:tetratricopeptide (TPR) repeat protein
VTDLAPFFPDYEIVGLVGRGGMGVVYRARQLELDRPVAIKILPVEIGWNTAQTERFRREARTLARLQHPSIVTVFDFGSTSDGHLYFVMEFVDGEDLARRMERGSLPLGESLDVLGRVCEALEYAHRENVVHRDIKPSNILLGPGGVVKVVDFGLALLATDESSQRLTRSSTALGTFEYSAPEQISGGSADHRADIYSVGVLAYELLTGSLPRGVFDRPSQKGAFDPAFDPVILRALQGEPDRRYGRVAEFQADLIAAHETALLAGTMELVGGSQAEVIRSFYERALGDLNPAIRTFIEDELLTDSGYRDSRALEDAVSSPGLTRDALDLLCARRLLRIEERGGIVRVEISHDRLTGAIHASRDARRSEEERARSKQREDESRRKIRSRNILIGAFTVLTGAAAGAAGFGWVQQNRAELEGKRARHNHEEAEKLVGFMVEDFRKRLDEIGRLDLLESVVGRVENYYKSMPEAGAGAESVRHKAAFYVSRAQMYRFQGRWADAGADLHEAVKISTAAMRQAPDQVEAMVELGNIHLHLAKLQGITREFESARRDAGEALRWHLEAANRFPDNLNLEFHVAKSRRHMGEILANLGRYEDGLQFLAAALEQMERLTSVEKQPEWLAELGFVHSELGSNYDRRGDLERALAEFRQMKELARQIAPDDRWHDLMHRQLFGGTMRVGSVLLQLQRYDESIVEFLEAEQLVSQHAKLSPGSTQILMEQRYCYASLSRAYFYKNNLAESKRYEQLSERAQQDLDAKVRSKKASG